ncbi:MAG: hypothetical protein IPM37_06115 [Hahellaceae bacterium]|jgi:hypothetical protein|nr:hypothetical protein [Hahellaceae bacterium]
MATLTYRSINKMPKYNYDDIVKVSPSAPRSARPGSKAWVVGIFETRRGDLLDSFPDGVVYTIEFEDGQSTEVHESNLDPE